MQIQKNPHFTKWVAASLRLSQVKSLVFQYRVFNLLIRLLNNQSLIMKTFKRTKASK